MKIRNPLYTEPHLSYIFLQLHPQQLLNFIRKHPLRSGWWASRALCSPKRAPPPAVFREHVDGDQRKPRESKAVRPHTPWSRSSASCTLTRTHTSSLLEGPSPPAPPHPCMPLCFLLRHSLWSWSPLCFLLHFISVVDFYCKNTWSLYFDLCVHIKVRTKMIWFNLNY